MCSWRDRPPSPHVTRMGRDLAGSGAPRCALGRDPTMGGSRQAVRQESRRHSGKKGQKINISDGGDMEPRGVDR